MSKVVENRVNYFTVLLTINILVFAIDTLRIVITQKELLNAIARVWIATAEETLLVRAQVRVSIIVGIDHNLKYWSEINIFIEFNADLATININGIVVVFRPWCQIFLKIVKTLPKDHRTVRIHQITKTPTSNLRLCGSPVEKVIQSLPSRTVKFVIWATSFGLYFKDALNGTTGYKSSKK